MRTTNLVGKAAFLATVLFAYAPSTSHAQRANEHLGTLTIAAKDGKTDELVPARIEIVGADGKYYVASDALPFGGDCNTSDEGAGYIDIKSTLAGFTDRIKNPYRKSVQFYSIGRATKSLPPGPARLSVFKGPAVWRRRACWSTRSSRARSKLELPTKDIADYIESFYIRMRRHGHLGDANRLKSDAVFRKARRRVR